MKLIAEIKKHLKRVRRAHNNPPVLDVWRSTMETQINVFRGGGRPVKGMDGYYTDGKETWGPRRTKFGFKNFINFNFYKHVESIGVTGWDFAEKKSYFAFFELDSLLHHGKGLTKEQIDAIVAKLKKCPYVTMYRSSRGAGIHVRVDLRGFVSTKDRAEHASLCRFVMLTIMRDCGLADFTPDVDACGGNMWVWHRAATKENGGYAPIQDSCLEFEVPENWRDLLAEMPSASKSTKEKKDRADYTDRAPTIWDEFNENPNPTLDELLAEAGGTKNDSGNWLRPGDTQKARSASVLNDNPQGIDIVHVFTDGWPPFEQGESYSPSAVYIAVRHGGDSAAAAKALMELGYGVSAPEDDFDAVVDEPEAAPVDESPREQSGPDYVISDEQLMVPGFIELFARWHALNPRGGSLRLGAVAGMLALSILIGRKLRHQDETRPNIYILMLCPSGYGKSEISNALKDFFCGIGLPGMVQDNAASGQGIEDYLFGNPRLLLVQEEFHDDIEAVKRHDGNKASVFTSLKKLFSLARTYLTYRLKANQKIGDKAGVDYGDKTVDQPFLSALLTAPESLFWLRVSLELLVGGLIGRCLFIQNYTSAKPNYDLIGDDFPEDEVLAAEAAREAERESLFNELLRIGCFWEGLEIETKTITVPVNRDDGTVQQVDLKRLVPFTVRWSRDARNLSVAAQKQWDEQADEAAANGDETLSSSLKRNAELVRKLELLFSSSTLIPPVESDDATTAEKLAGLAIEREHGERAIDIVSTLTSHKLDRILTRGGDERFVQDLRKIVRLVQKQVEKKGTEYTEYKSVLHSSNMTKKEFDDLLATAAYPGGQLIAKREGGKIIGLKLRPTTKEKQP